MNPDFRIRHIERLIPRTCLESAQPLPHGFAKRASSNGGACERNPIYLHQLKRRLLRAVLESMPDHRLFKRFCGAANEAADLAWETSFPQLVFPCLFHELVNQILRRDHEEQRQAARRNEDQPFFEIEIESSAYAFSA